MLVHHPAVVAVCWCGRQTATQRHLLLHVPTTVLLQKPVLRHPTVALPPQVQEAAQLALKDAPAQLPGHAPLLMGLVGTEGQLVGAAAVTNKNGAATVTSKSQHGGVATSCSGQGRTTKQNTSLLLPQRLHQASCDQPACFSTSCPHLFA